MRLIIKKNYDECAKWTADYIAGKIQKAGMETPGKAFVLGLPTGSTPLGVYKRLIELYQKKALSFRDIVTFNMDEYVGLPASHPQSYHYFMHTNFFDKIDINGKNVHILDGTAADPEAECAAYERSISAAGGIDLFLGGAGCDGHIAFNEPGSSLSSRTRVKTLTEDTRIVNSRFFNNNMNEVPKTALTVGIGTITDAKEVVIMMSGHNKAEALAHAVEQSVSQMWPVTVLQMHRNTIIVCDEACTDELKVGTVKYFSGIEATMEDPFVASFAEV